MKGEGVGHDKGCAKTNRMEDVVLSYRTGVDW